MGKSSKKVGKAAKNTSKPRSHGQATDTIKPTKSASKGSSLSLPSKVTTYTVPPAGWLLQMPYLAVSLPAQSLTPAQQLLIQSERLPSTGTDSEIYSISSLVTFQPTSNPLVQIRSITDPSHPAYPQSGLFANKTLPAGTHIVDYTGVIHSCPQPTCASSDYDLAFLDRDASLAIDSASMGNEGRFVNDYHGIREHGPNAVFEEYYVKIKSNKRGKEAWQARMGIWVAPAKSGLGIAKGEEICVSYGKGWWRARRSLMDGQIEEVEAEAEAEATATVGADLPEEEIVSEAVR